MQKKIALITGGSRGIGAACALRLGRSGYRAAVHYRSSPEKAKEICSELEDARSFQFDLSQAESCEELIKAVKQEMGGLDVLVNNAGVSLDQILPLAKLEDFEKTINLNLRPVFLLAKHACKLMLRQKSGRIINISSVVGFTGNNGQGVYAASKAAIVGFSKSIALDLARSGVLVNVVAPGFIESDMTASLNDEAKKAIMAKIPLQRMGSCDEVAAAVEFLASEGASYITGSTIHVNGGMFTN